MPEPKKFARPIFLVLTGIWLASCVQDPSAVVPADHRSIRAVVLAPPAEHPVQPRDPLVLVFDHWLDPRRSELDAAVSLSSGSLAVPVAVAYDPLTRTLTATPGDPLRRRVRYTWEVDPERLVGSGGRTLARLDPIHVTVAGPPSRAEDPSEGTGPPGTDTPPLRFEHVAPIFDEHCGCHGQDGLVALSPDALEGRSTIFAGRRLVEPFDPASSYLVEKMIPGYEDRFGTVMPPPWGDADPPTEAELRRVVDWIAAGARP